MLLASDVLTTYCSQAATGHVQGYIMCLKHERT